MNAWDMYANRIGVRGGSKRESIKNIEIRNIYTNLPDSLSYYDDVTIDGVQQTVAIINSDNLDEKTMISMPGENIKHGGLVHWMDQYWLVIEKDYNNTLYVRTKLQQCNYLLRWVSEDGVIHEQWCIVEDGTKYLTGELEDCGVSPPTQRCVGTTTHRIAGTPLELYSLKRNHEIWISVIVKKNIDWAISSQVPNRKRFNDYRTMRVGYKRNRSGGHLKR